jgi:hypothetical protein
LTETFLLVVGDGVKKEIRHGLGGVEEEVITTGIDADFNDYMSDQKHGLLPGIDLSDPHQLASLTKYVVCFMAFNIRLNPCGSAVAHVLKY